MEQTWAKCSTLEVAANMPSTNGYYDVKLANLKLNNNQKPLKVSPVAECYKTFLSTIHQF